MADIEAGSTSSAFVCNLGVMNQHERARYLALSRKLMSAGDERCELDNGYAFRLAPQKISLVKIAGSSSKALAISIAFNCTSRGSSASIADSKCRLTAFYCPQLQKQLA